MDSNLVGMTAAVTTSCLWTFGSLFFTSASKKIGSFSVNAYRVIIAVGFLVVANLLALGNPFPTATNEQWLWMGLSGAIGLGVGDFALLKAFTIAGPRLSLLMMSTSAIFTTAGAYLILGETIRPLGLIGIAITLTGIVGAIWGEDKSGYDVVPRKSRIQGTLLALIGAFGQGTGVVLAKKGIFSNPDTLLNPLSATLMRMLIGALFIWAIALAFRKLPVLHQALSDKEGIKKTALGALIGPFLGVTLSMIAVANTQTAIAQTLMSLMPILIIPVVWVLYKQKTRLREALGAITAVAGVAMLFLTQ